MRQNPYDWPRVGGLVVWLVIAVIAGMGLLALLDPGAVDVLGVRVAPAVIGVILGLLAEAQFRRALSISQGDWTVFSTDPLSLPS